jgi:hypothetical protein
MPARDAERRARGEDTRTDHVARVDRVTQRNVGVVLRADVADRRDAGQQRLAREVGAHQGASGNRDAVVVIGRRGGVGRDVRVRVDQTGQHGPGREVEHLGPGRDRCRCGRADRRDPSTFHDDDLVVPYASRGDVHEPARLDDRDGGAGRRRRDDRGRRDAGSDTRQCGGTGEQRGRGRSGHQATPACSENGMDVGRSDRPRAPIGSGTRRAMDGCLPRGRRRRKNTSQRTPPIIFVILGLISSSTAPTPQA